MTRNDETEFLLVGYSDDISRVLDEIGWKADSVAVVSECTPYDAVLPKGAVAVFVFSQYTHSSSQLLSWISYVHHLQPRRSYMMGLDGLDIRKEVFEYGGGFIRHLPVITIEQLGNGINNAE